ncbi:FAD-dependent oxidoreductase [Arthrobacter sp. AL12]|uniref:FAD-dependent oxidoreductase n=1 Tax=Arthrobacter sp. AL12 TaxID=3042241 RepID=UPI00249AAD56|nr:FAD-dependent oxidoreductase [Arthrobacter sp. AL12]MDI3213776.1 FAD-dependent oxidoreductase [Arthrobacter sp. AL12]
MGPTTARGSSAAAGTATGTATADVAETRKCYDVAVIGGGVVGHGIAWAARLSGRSVALIDDAPGSGASWAAAGMLAPVSELHYQEESLLELMLESSRLWPAFAAGLDGGPAALLDAGPAAAPYAGQAGGAGGARTGTGTGFLTTPTLAVGADAADRRALADLRTVQQAHGLVVEPLTVRAARLREPLLSPGISCAFDIPADHQVDPRRLLARIGELLAADGQCQTIARRAAGLLWADGRVAGASLAGGGSVRAGETIVANGLGAAALEGLPAGLRLPLRPVHGDILRLRVPERLRPLLTSTVRGLVRGVPVYIVPRQDGTVVIGATQREDALGAGSHMAAPAGGAPAGAPAVGGNPAGGVVSAGGVYQLLRDAQQLVPAVAELELLEATARARPGTPDNSPLLGRVAEPGCHGDVAGLIIATGFFRHGILLTPAAAEICRQLLDGVTDPRWASFRPDRFGAGTQGTGRPVTGTQDTSTQETSTQDTSTQDTVPPAAGAPETAPRVASPRITAGRNTTGRDTTPEHSKETV